MSSENVIFFGEVYSVVSASLSYVLKNIFLRITFYQKKGHFFPLCNLLGNLIFGVASHLQFFQMFMVDSNTNSCYAAI